MTFSKFVIKSENDGQELWSGHDLDIAMGRAKENWGEPVTLCTVTTIEMKTFYPEG